MISGLQSGCRAISSRTRSSAASDVSNVATGLPGDADLVGHRVPLN